MESLPEPKELPEIDRCPYGEAGLQMHDNSKLSYIETINNRQWRVLFVCFDFVNFNDDVTCDILERNTLYVLK